MNRAQASARPEIVPPVSEREIQAGMVSYAVECIAAVGLVILVVLSKVAA